MSMPDWPSRAISSQVRRSHNTGAGGGLPDDIPASISRRPGRCNETFGIVGVSAPYRSHRDDPLRLRSSRDALVAYAITLIVESGAGWRCCGPLLSINFSICCPSAVSLSIAFFCIVTAYAAGRPAPIELMSMLQLLLVLHRRFR